MKIDTFAIILIEIKIFEKYFENFRNFFAKIHRPFEYIRNMEFFMFRWPTQHKLAYEKILEANGKLENFKEF